MEKLRITLFSLALLVAALLALSCGTNSMPNTTGQLQSITITPPAATAPTVAGEVQFTATGHYSTAPYAVTPQPAVWGACFGGASTTEVTITTSGLATCGQVGGPQSNIYSVFAFEPTNCNHVSACGGGCTIVGTAQLTCPTTGD
jgi:hypothetical protein